MRKQEVKSEWLDLKSLCTYASVSERTLLGWIHRISDPLPASRVGKKFRVERSEFDRWMRAHSVAIETEQVDAMLKKMFSGG